MKKLIIIIGMLSLMACNCLTTDKYQEYLEWCDKPISVYLIRIDESKYESYIYTDSLGFDISGRRYVQEYRDAKISSLSDIDKLGEIGKYGIVEKPLSFEVLHRSNGKRDENPTFDKFIKWRNQQ